MKAQLFVYGLLMPGFQPPKTTSSTERDAVAGELYDLGEYPAAIKIGSSDCLIEGYTIEISASELEELDSFEEVHLGEYERIQVTTVNGNTVWVYQYLKILPESCKLINEWRPLPPR